MPLSNILNGECRTIKEYLKRNNPSDTDKHGKNINLFSKYIFGLNIQLDTLILKA